MQPMMLRELRLALTRSAFSTVTRCAAISDLRWQSRKLVGLAQCEDFPDFKGVPIMVTSSLPDRVDVGPAMKGR